MNKENLISSFTDSFTKRYPNHSHIAKKRLSNLEIVEHEHDSGDSSVASASINSIRFNGSIDSYENNFISYVSFHELFHILSQIFEVSRDSFSNYFDNYGYVTNIPETYLLKICNYDLNVVKCLKESLTCPALSNFNEGCNEFLTNELFDNRPVQYQSFTDSPLFIKTNKIFPCGYDFNVNLFKMLSSVVDIDTLLDVHLGNIIFKDFCNNFDSSFSDCLVDSSHEFPLYELLQYMCDIEPDHSDVRANPENYINASTLIIRAFHKQMKSTSFSSLDDLQNLYNKIKNIQNCIAFDIFKNYENRSDIQELREIEAEFLSVLSKFPESAETIFMRDNLSFQDDIIDSQEIVSFSKKIFNAKDVDVTSKNVFGKYLIPQSNTGDQRDLLYNMLYRYSVTSNGIMNCFQNPTFFKLASLISELPEKPVNEIDIKNYIKAQDCISSLLLTSFLEKNSMLPYSLKTIKPYHDTITSINDYSIVDSEKGRTNSEKNIRKKYSEIFQPLKRSALISATDIRNKLNVEVDNGLSKNDIRYIVLNRNCNDILNSLDELTLFEDRSREEI